MAIVFSVEEIDDMKRCAITPINYPTAFDRKQADGLERGSLHPCTLELCKSTSDSGTKMKQMRIRGSVLHKIFVHERKQSINILRTKTEKGRVYK